VTSTSLWRLTPWQPGIPTFSDEGARAGQLRSLYEFPGLAGTIAVVDSVRRPIRPVSEGWERVDFLVRRCSAATPQPRCSDRLAGAVFSGPAGLVLHISDRPWLDSLRRRHPPFLLRRARDNAIWSVVDSSPIVYRR
jgi:hypothetical protein